MLVQEYQTWKMEIERRRLEAEEKRRLELEADEARKRIVAPATVAEDRLSEKELSLKEQIEAEFAKTAYERDAQEIRRSSTREKDDPELQRQLVMCFLEHRVRAICNVCQRLGIDFTDYELPPGRQSVVSNDSFFKSIPMTSGIKDEDGLAFAQMRSPREMWVSLLEKAFAKMYGSYVAITAGQVSEAFVNLTGRGVGMSISLNSTETQAEIASGTFWSRILSFDRSGYFLGAGTPNGSDTTIDDEQIVQGHAYSVLKVCELPGNLAGEERIRLLFMRNPHGQTEWHGRWSDYDQATWDSHPFVKRKLQYSPQKDENEDEAFFIAFEDFVRHFATLHVCRFFDDTWERRSVVGQWNPASAETAARDSQFSLCVWSVLAGGDGSSIRNNGPVVVVLEQPEVRGSSDPFWFIMVACLNVDGKRYPNREVKTQIVARSRNGVFVDSRSVLLEAELEPDVVYTIVPRSILPKGIENGPVKLFRVQVFAQNVTGLYLQELPPA